METVVFHYNGLLTLSVNLPLSPLASGSAIPAWKIKLPTCARGIHRKNKAFTCVQRERFLFHFIYIGLIVNSPDAVLEVINLLLLLQAQHVLLTLGQIKSISNWCRVDFIMKL